MKLIAIKGWIEIARSGRYEGKMPLTRKVFESCVRRFPRQLSGDGDGIPVCLGHPGDDAPAWGWLTALQIRPNGRTGPDEGWSLYMQIQVQPELRLMLARKMFTGRSIALREVSKDVFELRHVAFLGGKAPAVPGMEKLKLSAVDDKQLFEFADLGECLTFQITQKESAMNFCPHCGAKLDASHTDTCPKCGQALTEFSASPPLEDSDGGDGGKDGEYARADKVAALEARLKEEEEKRTKQEAELAAERAARRLSEAKAFCEGLKREGRLVPAQEPGLAEFLAALPDKEKGLSYSDGKQTREPSLRAFMEAFLTAGPKLVEFGEVARRQVARVGETEVDIGDRDALDKAARNYAAEHKCPYDEALTVLVQQAEG